MQKMFGGIVPSRMILLLSILLVSVNCSDLKPGAQTFPGAGGEWTQILQAETFDELLAVDSLQIWFPEEHYLGIIEFALFQRNGNIVLVDMMKARKALLFNERGRFIRQLGEQGQGPGEYAMPSFVAEDESGTIYLADGRKVLKFDSDGDYLDTILLKNIVQGIIPFGDGSLAIHHRDATIIDKYSIWIYDSTGQVVEKLGRTSISYEKIHFNYSLTSFANHFVYTDNTFYETDFADYQIRAHRLDAGKRFRFGLAPPGWRSFDAVPERKPGYSVVAPADIGSLNDFYKKHLALCSQTKFLFKLTPEIICSIYWMKEPDGSGSYFLANLYDLSGKPIKVGLPFKMMDRRGDDMPVSYYVAGGHDEIFGIIYHDDPVESAADITIMRFRNKSD